MLTIPHPLRSVAWLFIIGGILLVMQTIAGLFVGRIILNLGFLSIFIGHGLLRLSSRWLAWAKFYICVMFISAFIGAFICLFTALDLQVFGFSVSQVPRVMCLVFCVAMFAITYWQYSVLTSRPVRQLFVS